MMSLTERFETLDTRPLIANTAASPRDSARLMIVSKTAKTIEHRFFRDICAYFRPGDCLVVNDSKVFPARLAGKKTSGGKFELLLVRPFEGETKWLALCEKCRPGIKAVFEDGLEASALSKAPGGEWIFEFSRPDVMQYCEKYGKMPLPPYIIKARKTAQLAPSAETDKSTYQTVYATNTGSIAAPTAGFHFTPEILSRLEAKGVKIAKVTLHVGWGTFKPVSCGPENHKMPAEYAEITPQAADRINAARKSGGRVFSVGTTSTRTLETFCAKDGALRAANRWADLFITPPYNFKAIDALITNFHLPDSTPLYLAAAFAGEDLLYTAYTQALELKYRFYSFGDAMLIL